MKAKICFFFNMHLQMMGDFQLIDGTNNTQSIYTIVIQKTEDSHFSKVISSVIIYGYSAA